MSPAIMRANAPSAAGMVEQRLQTPGLLGRIPEQANLDLLSALEVVRRHGGQEIQICNPGRLRGRLKSLSTGVRRMTAVQVDGRKCVGLAAAREVLRSLADN